MTALKLVQLTSSRFFGGPERQMLELAKELGGEIDTTFISFSEDGLCQAFLNNVREHGFPAHRLVYDTPRLLAAATELKQYLRSVESDILCCHGYKSNLLGLWAARTLGIPVVSVSRGWTSTGWKIQLYEWLDRLVLARMDQIVCVSEGQAEKVRKAGVPAPMVKIIPNAIRIERFQRRCHDRYRHELERLFPSPPSHIVGAAGRLSPEKGFDVLVDACRVLVNHDRLDIGIVLFGDGPLKEKLQTQIDVAGLTERFILAGFTNGLDLYMPQFDIFVQSSYTEGLPNVLLEAAAAGVPAVATNVGGTREVVDDGKTGVLVPHGDAPRLGNEILRLLEEPVRMHKMKAAAQVYVAEHFNFCLQASEYRSLFRSLRNRSVQNGE